MQQFCNADGLTKLNVVLMVMRKHFTLCHSYHHKQCGTEESAFNTDQMKLIDSIATIQTHIDQGISTILYVNSEISTRELARLYVYVHYKGLKSLYYTRNKLLSMYKLSDLTIKC